MFKTTPPVLVIQTILPSPPPPQQHGRCRRWGSHAADDTGGDSWGHLPHTFFILYFLPVRQVRRQACCVGGLLGVGAAAAASPPCTPHSVKAAVAVGAVAASAPCETSRDGGVVRAGEEAVGGGGHRGDRLRRQRPRGGEGQWHRGGRGEGGRRGVRGCCVTTCAPRQHTPRGDSVNRVGRTVVHQWKINGVFFFFLFLGSFSDDPTPTVGRPALDTLLHGRQP